MNTSELINEIHNKTIEIYQTENLKCLRENEKEDYNLNGKNILIWHSEATKNLKQDLNHFENIDNLLFISDEIMYFTSQLFLYRPFLYNPLDNPVWVNKKTYFPYSMYIVDRRYFMYTEVAFEKVYAYWGQIAKLLAATFEEKLDETKIFFPRIIQNLPKKDSENYTWLSDFMRNAYTELNSHRKLIVHHRGSETKFKFDHLKAGSNKEQMEDLIHNRDGLPEYFKKHIELTLIGFEKSLNLISEN